MAARIAGTDEGSIAEQLGLKAGDTLVSINGGEINDVIDYMYYSGSEVLALDAICGGEPTEFEIEKDPFEPLGINFDTYLIDKQRSCKNKCIFCFIDQLPKGLRKTLYFKDDDARLSFLMGNYITLTNLSEKDVERICDMRISPINVSVHTTDPELRVKMMRNPRAARINEIMKRFADAGITMNCQIVLCKNVNDGDNLLRSLHDLEKLWPAVASVSVVPVGLSRHREGLYPLESFTESDCQEVIRLIESVSRKCREKYGVGLFYPSDEFFIKGGVPLPCEDYYDGYPQIENGVGMSVSFLTEVDGAVEELEADDAPVECGVITGVLSAGLLEQAAEKVRAKRPNVRCEIFAIQNDFFGREITVAGLVTATDIKAQLAGKKLPERMLIPGNMLRSEQDMFLDSVTLPELEAALGRKLGIVGCDGYEFVKAITERGDSNG